MRLVLREDVVRKAIEEAQRAVAPLPSSYTRDRVVEEAVKTALNVVEERA